MHVKIACVYIERVKITQENEMDIQRLRNLTTGWIHTRLEHVYEDIEEITGECGVMTHQLSNAVRAIHPYLREKITDARFWDGKNDPTHTGDIDVPTMNAVEQEAMWKRYAEEQETMRKIYTGE
jgi:cytochrome c peroxidase